MSKELQFDCYDVAGVFVFCSQVVLDPLLASLLLTKAEGDRGTLTWDAVFSR